MVRPGGEVGIKAGKRKLNWEEPNGEELGCVKAFSNQHQGQTESCCPAREGEMPEDSLSGPFRDSHFQLMAIHDVTLEHKTTMTGHLPMPALP